MCKTNTNKVVDVRLVSGGVWIIFFCFGGIIAYTRIGSCGTGTYKRMYLRMYYDSWNLYTWKNTNTLTHIKTTVRIYVFVCINTLTPRMGWCVLWMNRMNVYWNVCLPNINQCFLVLFFWITFHVNVRCSLTFRESKEYRVTVCGRRRVLPDSSCLVNKILVVSISDLLLLLL